MIRIKPILLEFAEAFELPNGMLRPHDSECKAFAWEYNIGKIITGDYGDNHWDMKAKDSSLGLNFNKSGRAWVKSKVIAVWHYNIFAQDSAYRKHLKSLFDLDSNWILTSEKQCAIATEALKNPSETSNEIWIPLSHLLADPNIHNLNDMRRVLKDNSSPKYTFKDSIIYSDERLVDLIKQFNQHKLPPHLREGKYAVHGDKVEKYITGHNLTIKGKKYPTIEFELVRIDNSTKRVVLRILAPKELFGIEIPVKFQTLRRGPFLKTIT